MREVEGRYLARLGFRLIARYGRIGEEQVHYEAGAAEVHVRISSPPIISQCYYGIDFAEEDELIAAKRTVEEVREYIGATTLAYLSLDGLQASTRRPESSFCRACLTRDYPTAVPRESTKLRFEAAR